MAREEVYAEEGDAEEDKVDHHQGALRAHFCGGRRGDWAWHLEGGGEQVMWIPMEFFFSVFFLCFIGDGIVVVVVVVVCLSVYKYTFTRCVWVTPSFSTFLSSF